MQQPSHPTAEPPASERIWGEVQAAFGKQRLPEATYRLQFHSGFTFRDATALVPYLEALGITDAYASPYLKARPGSRHGYDITDHSHLNPEIGSDEDHAAWCAALQSRGMGQILDIVPNHMAVVGNDNVWWNDVLENGPSSPYAHYFDILWSASPREEDRPHLLVPILGEPYGSVLESQQLRLCYVAGAFAICYFEHRFPVAVQSYEPILAGGVESLATAREPSDPGLLEYQSILTAIRHLPPWTAVDIASVAEIQREKEVIKRRLATLTSNDDAIAAVINDAVASFNGTPGKPESFDRLEQLLDLQPYRLAYWRVAADEINYRRFFDVNELAALNMEFPDVFAATHELVFQLLERGQITGLRIDHPDGLFDPRQYLRRLQERYLLGAARAAAERDGLNWDDQRPDLESRIGRFVAENERRSWPLYVVVEKILAGGESLRSDWPVFGTTGYDFLTLINGLFVAGENAIPFSRLYREWIEDDSRFADWAYRSKTLIMQSSLSSELQMLAFELDRLSQKKRWSRDFTQHSLRQVLRAVIASFPVYRTYIGPGEIAEADAKHVMRAVGRAMAYTPTISSTIFAFVRDSLLLRQPGGSAPDEDYQAEQRHFAGKFQQLTAPVMAKGVEDTAFYIYNRLLSLNEVGGSPERFGCSPGDVHRQLAERLEHPWSLAATSTHDTKRSEDVRARLNVLSELPSEWRACVERWSAMNRRHRTVLEDGPAPDANEEYYLYQTLIGAWPIETATNDDHHQFVERIQAHMHKALQEAKVHTSWINMNAEYAEAVNRFVGAILDRRASAEFLADFCTFQERVSRWGMCNSLSQVVLKTTAPGVADVYQGTELWDFSLVDPDNRRPVDFVQREQMLAEIRSAVEAAGDRLAPLICQWAKSASDGRIKLYLLWRSLTCRHRHPGHFAAGEYLPIETSGKRREHIFAFLRRSAAAVAITAVPRLISALGGDGLPVGPAVWDDTVLTVPNATGVSTWVDEFTGRMHRIRDGKLPAAEAFADLPLALLMEKRRAG